MPLRYVLCLSRLDRQLGRFYIYSCFGDQFFSRGLDSAFVPLAL